MDRPRETFNFETFLSFASPFDCVLMIYQLQCIKEAAPTPLSFSMSDISIFSLPYLVSIQYSEDCITTRYVALLKETRKESSVKILIGEIVTLLESRRKYPATIRMLKRLFSEEISLETIIDNFQSIESRLSNFDFPILKSVFPIILQCGTYKLVWKIFSNIVECNDTLELSPDIDERNLEFINGTGNVTRPFIRTMIDITIVRDSLNKLILKNYLISMQRMRESYIACIIGSCVTKDSKIKDLYEDEIINYMEFIDKITKIKNNLKTYRGSVQDLIEKCIQQTEAQILETNSQELLKNLTQLSLRCFIQKDEKTYFDPRKVKI